MTYYILLKTLRLAFSASITPDFRYEIILTVLARYESCTEKSIWRICQELKDSTRSAVACNGLIIAQGFTSYGTTSHRFMKAYPEWVSRATNWNKFNAVASLGLIHIGQEQHAMSFLRSYMPSEGRTTFGYQEGGAYFAYGVKQNCEKYVADLIGNKSNPMMRATGVSVLSMAYVGTGDPDVVRRLLEKIEPTQPEKRTIEPLPHSTFEIDLVSFFLTSVRKKKGGFLPALWLRVHTWANQLLFVTSSRTPLKKRTLTRYGSTEEWDRAPVSLVGPKCHSEVPSG
ncbi:unnamed protein product [Caenorhabditis auriculariae]|uniref:Uncharacterized protein n=1 Tax=Caenorhabditis auriculariae TaxID=2777116 RepID=A0A8S1HN77_9PELO|nr:unnamed protein product [Caenorhabditis auriculariae]